MRQPVKGKKNIPVPKKPIRKPYRHKKYGTSLLEADFAHDFLDRLGLRYVYQYEAKEIGRYYDFAVTADSETDFKYVVKDGLRSIDQNSGGFSPDFIIEVDGDYWHANPKFIDESKLNNAQKRTRKVDKLKDYWCGTHCIPLLRLWENDIRSNPSKVDGELAAYSSVAARKLKAKRSKKLPH